VIRQLVFIARECGVSVSVSVWALRDCCIVHDGIPYHAASLPEGTCDHSPPHRVQNKYITINKTMALPKNVNKEIPQRFIFAICSFIFVWCTLKDAKWVMILSSFPSQCHGLLTPSSVLHIPSVFTHTQARSKTNHRRSHSPSWMYIFIALLVIVLSYLLCATV
jgi:hypothetical protein